VHTMTLPVCTLGYLPRLDRKECVRRKLCPLASFECDSIIGKASRTQYLIAEGTQDLSLDGDWTVTVEEDFTTGFGVFNHHGNNAKHYTSAFVLPMEKMEALY